jgi:hypothetical protein
VGVVGVVCGVRSWQMDDETEALGKVRWTVQELLSSWELAAEGRAMNHCVVSYSDQCADGHRSVWSIGVLKEGAQEREGVLTVWESSGHGSTEAV